MNAKELRVGNFVEIDNKEYHPLLSGKVCQVIGIKSQISRYFPDSKHTVEVAINLSMYSQWEEFVKPIPLTEEWIEKLGANDLGYFYVGTGNAYNSNPIDPNGFYFGIDEEGGIEICRVNYVHQLQNIVYVITGKELTLK